nr:MAG TPA: hypothetical protein [Caudoviricetes sp.]
MATFTPSKCKVFLDTRIYLVYTKKCRERKEKLLRT